MVGSLQNWGLPGCVQPFFVSIVFFQSERPDSQPTANQVLVIKQYLQSNYDIIHRNSLASDCKNS